jgi:hypothetical protein
MILVICLSYIAFIMLKYIPSISRFLRVFIMKCDESYPKFFLHLLI